MKKSIIVIFFTFYALFFTACDDSTFAAQTETNTTVSISLGGVVVDGYISGAEVCLDFNLNSVCDESEATTYSDANGIFSFNSDDFSGYDYVSIIASGGIDTATNKPFTGELKTIVETQNISENTNLIINPLTDLVAISFLGASVQNSTVLTDSIREVADVYSLYTTDLFADPMQNIALFATVQEIQNLKALILTAAQKSYTNTTDIQAKIKEALVIQIKDSDGALNLDRVLDMVEINLNIIIPQNERTFIIGEIAEITRALNAFVEDPDIDVSNLDRLQLALENELEQAYTNLANAVEGESLEVLPITITYEFITQSSYEQTDAVADERACLAQNGYMSISDTSFDPDRASDDLNGVSIESKFDFSTDINATMVELFYPQLDVNKTMSNTIVFTDYDFTFVFDQAWLENENKTLYIQTPKNENGLYGCYRAELNSTIASEIKVEKVFRYLDIE